MHSVKMAQPSWWSLYSSSTSFLCSQKTFHARQSKHCLNTTLFTIMIRLSELRNFDSWKVRMKWRKYIVNIIAYHKPCNLKFKFYYCINPLFLLINKLCLHQFLRTKTTDTNKLLITDANKAY